MNPALYIDSDGLVADWVKRMIALVAHPEIVCQETLNKHPDRSVLIQGVYAEHPELFGDLPPIELGVRLVESLQSLGIPFKMLTAVGEDHPSFDVVKRNKITWFATHLGVAEEDVICVQYSSDKAQYVSDLSILVDDYEKNIVQWEASGGIGLHFNNTEENVVQIIERITELFWRIKP